MNTKTHTNVTAAARETYRASLDANGDHGVAEVATHEQIKAMVGERTGSFDAETLTWTFDSDAAERIKRHAAWYDREKSGRTVDRAVIVPPLYRLLSDDRDEGGFALYETWSHGHRTMVLVPADDRPAIRDLV